MSARWSQASATLVLAGFLAGLSVSAQCQDPEGLIQRKPPAAPPVTNPPPGHLPCNWTGDSGGQGVTRNRHYLGDKPGIVAIQYELYTIPDDVTVTYGGRVLASTSGPRSGGGGLTFDWRPNGRDYSIVVTVTGPLSGTRWRYAMACPR